MGSGMVAFEREFGTSYKPSIVTFPLSLRVSEIMPLLCPERHFPRPTSSLPKISRCSPESRWMAFELRRAKVLG